MCVCIVCMMYAYGSQHPCSESVDSKIDCSFLTFAAKIMMHFISESIELRIFLPYAAAAACCIPTKQGKTLCKCNTVLSFCSVSNLTTLILTSHYLQYCFKRSTDSGWNLSMFYVYKLSRPMGRLKFSLSVHG